MTVLLCCPFCGGEPIPREWRYQDREGIQYGSIGCDHCGIQIVWNDIRTPQRHDTEGELRAITKWNSRVT